MTPNTTSHTEPQIGHAYLAYRIDHSRHKCNVVYQSWEGGRAVVKADDGKFYYAQRISDDHVAPVYEFKTEDVVA